MEFEETVKDIVDKNYNGDSDKFLRSLRLKTILFLLSGGFWIIASVILYNAGGRPYLSGILGVIIFIIGVLSHRLYNQCYKVLNK